MKENLYSLLSTTIAILLREYRRANYHMGAIIVALFIQFQKGFNKEIKSLQQRLVVA